MVIAMLLERVERYPGRSCVQLVNLANTAAYVVARIVLAQLSGRASEEFQLISLSQLTKYTCEESENAPCLIGAIVRQV
jgi:hypothetical protein